METEKYTNHLANESSPYLLQHSRNPVDWYPWGERALDKAKAENKLIIISVGYAACHWCHVMERESFEDSLVAAVMNENFVSIKVDREERPDIDQIYMDAVQLMTGSGGWPLNVVALPDGRPIWGGTYFPKKNWINALEQLADLWKNNPTEAIGYADNLTTAIQRIDSVQGSGQENSLDHGVLTEVLRPWKEMLDMDEGGYSRAPKFPLPNNWLFFLRATSLLKDTLLENSVQLTLEKMARGGIYDQVGGGFARYSVDHLWMVPHFEKMTYDNGQLVSLYSEAYRKYRNPLYRRIVEETLEFVLREMTSPEGGFYSSLDADSEGEEGKYYIWTRSELENVLGEDAGWFCEYYQVTPEGNWEHGNNVLIIGTSPEQMARKLDMDILSFHQKLFQLKEKLYAVREKRPRPALDDKILLSWNALQLKGFIDAYKAFGDPRWLEVALRNAAFIEKNFRDGERLNRNFMNGRSSINAFLEDYALLADAYIALYQVTMDEEWLMKANAWVQISIKHFYNETSGFFYYTSDLDPALISRKTEMSDNVIPASNSVMANVLFDLSVYLENQEYEKMAVRMLANVKDNMVKYGSGYSNWAILLLKKTMPFHEVVITGEQSEAFIREFNAGYCPNTLLAATSDGKNASLKLFEGRLNDNETRVFVCKNKVCNLPVKSVNEAFGLIVK